MTLFFSPFSLSVSHSFFFPSPQPLAPFSFPFQLSAPVFASQPLSVVLPFLTSLLEILPQ